MMVHESKRRARMRRVAWMIARRMHRELDYGLGGTWPAGVKATRRMRGYVHVRFDLLCPSATDEVVS